MLDFFREGLQAGTHGPFQWKGETGGDTIVEIYGNFGASNATMQYSSNGKTGDYLNVEVPNLVGATVDVRLEAVKLAKKYWFQLVITAGNGAERLTWVVGAV